MCDASTLLLSAIALCVVGNKCDLSGEREVSRDQGLDFAHQIGAMFTETSASQNTGNLFQSCDFTPMLCCVCAS